MDLIPTHTPVIADPVPLSKPRIIMPSNLPSRGQAGLFPHLSTWPSLSDEPLPGYWTTFYPTDGSTPWPLRPPPRRRLCKDAFADSLQDDPETSYRLWMLKYPSALSAFEQIAEKAKGKRVALFLDYDGTLSPIVDDPDRAFMSDSMRAAVRDAVRCVPIAIISGRSRDKVYEFVGLSDLYYAGSHGMDIVGPVRDSATADDHPNCIRSSDKQGKEVSLFQPASEFVPMIEEVFESLVDSTSDINGANVENNKFCVSVHYRNVDEENWPVVAQRVHDTLKRYPRLRLSHGRKVLEIRPVIEWNKGKAVEFLLESLGLDHSDDVLPIYIGDDRTDEDAFEVLRGRGVGILVSSLPKESKASFSLRDPSEVKEFLKMLVSWKSN